MNKIFNRIGFAIGIFWAKLSKRYKPFQVQFSITNRCNLRCCYCYANYPERGTEELSTEEIFRVIDELKSAGTKRLNLVGGEPLIRKDIGEIIDYVKKKGIECVMTSNGALVPAKINEVKKLDLLCISLDGDQASNDANRGVGSYEKALKALDTAKKEGIPLQIATVITKNNLNSLEFMLELAKDYGVTVGFSTLINQTVDGKKSVPVDIPTDEEYREVFRKLIRFKEEGYPVLFSKLSLQYALDWKYGYEKDKLFGEEPDFNHICCNAGRFFAIVDVNGDVYPCPSLVDVIQPENVLKVGMKEAFRHINSHKCYTCHIPCQNEFNLMYSLNPSVIMNIAKNYKRGWH